MNEIKKEIWLTFLFVSIFFISHSEIVKIPTAIASSKVLGCKDTTDLEGASLTLECSNNGEKKLVSIKNTNQKLKIEVSLEHSSTKDEDIVVLNLNNNFDSFSLENEVEEVEVKVIHE